MFMSLDSKLLPYKLSFLFEDPILKNGYYFVKLVCWIITSQHLASIYSAKHFSLFFRGDSFNIDLRGAVF